MSTYKEVGNILKEYIKKRGITQDSLQEPLKKKRANVSMLVNGNKAMNLGEAQILSKILKIEFTINGKGVKIKDKK